ncbi:MAG TPA: GNAT family N-acetyltransferase [Candidatus Mcinerneyibacterium sp.]|nr:GNAT family N-acetyltransferase [Candidatus Mcinerneyibacterium sp.]
MYKIKENIKSYKKILTIYEKCNWKAYTNDKERLIRAIENSDYNISVWDKKKLIGFSRIITDNEHILYLQDILVLPGYQNMGIGSKMLKKIVEKYSHIRQKVLIADKSKLLKNFYLKNEFKLIKDYPVNCFIRLENYDVN